MLCGLPEYYAKYANLQITFPKHENIEKGKL